MSCNSGNRYAERFSAEKILLFTVLFFCLITTFLIFCVQNTNAREIKPGEYRVKAAFLYNFLKFIEWPANNDPGLTVCILGEDPFGNDIDALLNETVSNRKLSVSYVSDYEVLKKCNLVFISHSEADYLAEIIKTAREYRIVTVGDTEGFADQGVMLNFYLQENKVRFEINKDAADRSGIRISSKLLNLAKIVSHNQKR
jgi:hypothetical protein